MEKAELYYSEVRRRTDEQCQARQHFDTTAIAVLGFAGVLLSLMPVAASKWTDYSIYPAAVTCAAFVVIATTTIYGLWLRGWQFQPNLKTLAKNINSNKYSDNDLVTWSAKWMFNAMAINKKVLTIKTRCLRIAYIALAVEALGLVVIFVLGVYLHPVAQLPAQALAVV